MASILPVTVDLDLLNITVNSKPSYRPAPNFDFKKGDFVRDAAGKIIYTDGHEAWRQWCIKTALTERDAYIAYTTNIGVEMDEAGRQRTRAARLSAVERTITEALMVHPMTESVRAFEFKFLGDGSLAVSFDVYGENAAAFTIDLSYKAVGR